jgi:hypothetical protein
MSTVELTIGRETNLSHLFHKSWPQDTELVFDQKNQRVIMWHPESPTASILILDFSFHKGDWQLMPYTAGEEQQEALYESLLQNYIQALQGDIRSLKSQVNVLTAAINKTT